VNHFGFYVQLLILEINVFDGALIFFLLICSVSGAVYKFTDAQGHAGFLDWDNVLW
jgi:hypothetical protein